MFRSNLFKFCNETIHPGESLSLALPLPELFSCAPLHMPIKIVHGKLTGPCVLIMAAVHGNELNGTEIINRLLQMSCIKKLAGTIIAVPVVNVFGLINRSRYLLGAIELNKAFPGSKEGPYAARMANLIYEQLISKADMIIDLQTGYLNHASLPHVYAHPLDNKANALAKVFNTPVISHLAIEDGLLATFAYEKSKPYLLYEAGEAMRFDDYAIKTGVKGILNILRQQEMLSPSKPQKAVAQAKKRSFVAEHNIWLRAPSSGVSHSKIQLGQHVQQEEVLCTISDPFGVAESAIVRSPEEGIIVGVNKLPLVQEGETLYQLAIFEKMQSAADRFEEWQEQHDSGK